MSPLSSPKANAKPKTSPRLKHATESVLPRTLAAGHVSVGGSSLHAGGFPRDSDRARSPTELQPSTAKRVQGR